MRAVRLLPQGNSVALPGGRGRGGIGWILGHLIDGTQAELVRIPFADTSLYQVPEGVTDEQAMMLSDILPTGFEIGVQYGRVKPGDTVAVVGAGPVGLAVIATAGLYGAAQVIAVDLDENRLEQAKSSAPRRRQLRRRRLEGAGHGADRRLGRRRRRRGGRSPGDVRDVHRDRPPRRQRRQRRRARQGGRARLQKLWIQNISISMGLVNTDTTPMLLKLVASASSPSTMFATHHFELPDMMDAYDTFGRAAETKALKVVIDR